MRRSEPRPTKGSEKLRRARKAADLSQEALGEQLSATQSAVSRWETGDEVPTGTYLDAVCARFPKIRKEDFQTPEERTRVRKARRLAGAATGRARAPRGGAA